MDAEPALRWSDAIWRVIFRIAYPLATLWWRMRRARHEGALVAVEVGSEMLLLRSSYRRAWNLPGGGIKRGGTPEEAARRELREETGLAAERLRADGAASGYWEGRRDTVHFFTLRLDRLPALRLDNREIIGAHLVSKQALRDLAERGALTGPLAVYVGRKSGTDR